MYVAGYTAGRLWIELLRIDEATKLFGARINVWTSILVFVAAVLVVIKGLRNNQAEGHEEQPKVFHTEVGGPKVDRLT